MESDVPDDAMNDLKLMASFEEGSLPRSAWNHRAHVRVAYNYSAHNDLQSAIDKARSGIRFFNHVTRTPDTLDRGYHETITQAFMHLVFSKIENDGPFTSSFAFCSAHPELLDSHILREYYSRDKLMTWEAKYRFMQPDLKPLPSISKSTKSSDATGRLQFVEELSVEQVQQLHKLVQQQWWGGNRSLADVRIMVENTSLMVALIDATTEQLIAYCRTLTDFAFRATIYDVMVDRGLQGQGLGTELVEYLCQHPRLRRVNFIYLACEPKLFPFYQQWGFQPYEGRAEWMIKIQRPET